MKRFFLLSKIFAFGFAVLFFSTVAEGNITITAAYYKAEAKAVLAPGTNDSDSNVGFVPQIAVASTAADNKSSALALAATNVLSFKCYALTTVFPYASLPSAGASIGTGVDLLFELESDTAWKLNVFASSAQNVSASGQANAIAKAVLFDAALNQIYNFDMAVNGNSDSQNFNAGKYNLVLFGGASALANIPPQGSPAFAQSVVTAYAELIPIPVPGACLLATFGIGITGFIRRHLSK